jgi:hypothetical protein
MSPSERARETLEREMDPAEFDRACAACLADEEDRRAVRELIAWFSRRYPTVEERLAYVRRRVRRGSGQGAVRR